MSWDTLMVAIANNAQHTRRTALQTGLLAACGIAAARAAGPQIPEPRVRRTLQPGSKCTTPAAALRLALKDASSCEARGVDPVFTRYVWIPDNIDPQSGFRQVALIVNSTFTRTSNLIQPRLIQDGTAAVVAIDLCQYAGKEKQVPEIVDLYERLAPRDSWFNQEIVVAGDVVQKVDDELRGGMTIEIRLRDGKWAPATFKARKGSLLTCEYDGKQHDMKDADVRLIAAPPPPAKRSFTALPYLNPEGVQLFDVTRSAVPIMRLDEWVAFTFSTINGGLYYELAGVERNLADTIARFAGFEAAKKVLREAELLRLAEAAQKKPGEKRGILEIAAEFDSELAKSKAVMNKSGVTGRQRAFLFVTGANVAPADGVQLVCVTYDIAEDNTGADSDPQRNLTVYEKYNGGEAIVAMPNGLLLYLVFDEADKIIASVPDNVAHDSQAQKVRGNVATVRVFSGTSCANCHEGSDRRNWGYQPVTNELAASLRSLAQILGNRGNVGKELKDKLQELQRIASAYKADDAQMQLMLDAARLTYQRAVGNATGAKSSREVISGVADSHWGYWYDDENPEDAVAEISGQVLRRAEAIAWLIDNIEPNPLDSLHVWLREDIIVDRLKRGLSITPAQWRAIAPNVFERYVVSRSKRLLLEPAPVEGKQP